SATIIAPDSASVRKGVLALVTDPKLDRLARADLAHVAQKVNLPLAEAVPALATQTKSTDLLVRKGAVVILGLVRPVTDAAIQSLISALSDESADVRGLSAESLGDIGPEAQAALPTLDHLMKTDRDAAVRNFSSAAYYRISPSICSLRLHKTRNGGKGKAPGPRARPRIRAREARRSACT